MGANNPFFSVLYLLSRMRNLPMCVLPDIHCAGPGVPCSLVIQTP